MFLDAIRLDQCGVGWCYFLGYKELFWTGPVPMDRSLNRENNNKKHQLFIKRKREFLIELKYYA